MCLPLREGVHHGKQPYYGLQAVGGLFILTAMVENLITNEVELSK